MQTDPNRSVDHPPSSGRTWKWARYGLAMIILAVVIYCLDIFLMMQFSTKFLFFRKFNDYLIFVGTALIAWNVYVNYFRGRSK
jgi:hypothetical protein